MRRSDNASLQLRDPPSPALHFDECWVGNTGINVRIAAEPQVLSAPRMWSLLRSAAKYADRQITQHDQRVDRPLSDDELPFQFDGTGRDRGYFIDVDEYLPGVLTWGKIGITTQGLLTCGFRRQLYRAITFEIWEEVIGVDSHER